MKLIVGLGNPGKEYLNTRHNIGFIVLDKVADKLNEKYNNNKFDGLYFIKNINDEKVIFLKPQKYMNLSGEVVSKFVNYFHINIEDILIICDDLDLPTGKIRMRKKGSSGGHNGLKNISLRLKTENFKRLKIGISNNKLFDTKDYVLSKFSKEETNMIDNQTSLASNICLEFIKEEFDKLMSKYN